MPKLDFQLTTDYIPGFRTDAVASMFDLPITEKLTKTFNVNLPIEDTDWKIGLIYGPSGSGKTQIAKKLFPNHYHQGYQWDNRAIVENFPKGKTVKDITKALSSVGFSSPPDWAKPFNVLSNGQQFRAEIARLLLDDENYPDLVVLDEFTSLVDRQVARASSAAVQRYIRNSHKQFIAVTCHSDIIEWLSPDWTYEVAGDVFTAATGRSLQRVTHPEIRLRVVRIDRKAWNELGISTNHYLSSVLPSGHCYGAFWENKLVAFCAVRKFPHMNVQNGWAGSRLVVLPDFQGLGIGVALDNAVAHHYCQHYNQRFFGKTSHPAMIASKDKSEQWMLFKNAGMSGKPSEKGRMTGLALNRATVSFEYVGNERGEMKDKQLNYIGDIEKDKDQFFKTVKRT